VLLRRKRKSSPLSGLLDGGKSNGEDISEKGKVLLVGTFNVSEGVGGEKKTLGKRKDKGGKSLCPGARNSTNHTRKRAGTGPIFSGTLEQEG